MTPEAHKCLEPAGGGQAQVRGPVLSAAEGRETVSDSIVKHIAGLHRLTGAQLKERWRELFGTEPPGYNRTFLIKRLAYRLQELTHGGLSGATQAKKKDIPREAGLSEDSAIGGKGSAAATCRPSVPAPSASPGRFSASNHPPNCGIHPWAASLRYGP